MTKTFCDKCGVEINEDNVFDPHGYNFGRTIVFPIFEKDENIGDTILNKPVKLKVVFETDNISFSVCIGCVLKTMKKFIDSKI